MIVFSDFKKLDIRIGTVLIAEKVENTGKLMRLEVDMGSEKRQLVAGIARHYEPKELIGKQIPVLFNIEPRIVCGIESQGMILAADDGGRPILLHPDKAIPDGSIVR